MDAMSIIQKQAAESAFRSLLHVVVNDVGDETTRGHLFNLLAVHKNLRRASSMKRHSVISGAEHVRDTEDQIKDVLF